MCLQDAPIVGGHTIVTVARVLSVLDQETSLLGHRMALHSSQQLRGLAGEHGPKDNMNAASPEKCHRILKMVNETVL
jgi:hypothetical protein